MTRTICFLATALTSGCGCDLDATEAELAGEDAKDCGLADGDRAASVWECAIAELERGEAFRVSWFGQSMDTTDLTSLVSDGEHHWVLPLDDYKGPARISGQDCIEPRVGVKGPDAHDPSKPSGYDYIECRVLEPRGNHYQVCGKAADGSTEPLPFDP